MISIKKLALSNSHPYGRFRNGHLIQPEALCFMETSAKSSEKDKFPFLLSPRQGFQAGAELVGMTEKRGQCFGTSPHVEPSLTSILGSIFKDHGLYTHYQV